MLALCSLPTNGYYAGVVGADLVPTCLGMGPAHEVMLDVYSD